MLMTAPPQIAVASKMPQRSFVLNIHEDFPRIFFPLEIEISPNVVAYGIRLNDIQVRALIVLATFCTQEEFNDLIAFLKEGIKLEKKIKNKYGVSVYEHIIYVLKKLRA